MTGFTPWGGSIGTGSSKGGGSSDPKSALLKALGGLAGGGQDTSHSNQDIGTVKTPQASGSGSLGSPVKTAAGTAGGGKVAGGIGSVSTAQAPNLTNTAKTPPDVQWLIDQIHNRASGPGTAGTAIDLAGSKIRDAGAGLSSALSADAARRGVLDSGVASSQQQGLASDLQRQIAGAAEDISLGREKDIDALLLGSQGLMEAPARLGQADKSLALQQYLGQAGLDLQKYGIDNNAMLQQNAQSLAAQQQIMSLLMNLWS